MKAVASNGITRAVELGPPKSIEASTPLSRWRDDLALRQVQQNADILAALVELRREVADLRREAVAYFHADLPLPTPSDRDNHATDG
jgi:hypothetical protein